MISIKKIHKIWELLNKDNKTKFIFLQILIIVAASLEVLSILGIGPFVSVILGVITLNDVPIVGKFITSSFENNHIYYLGLFVSILIIISNLFFAFTLYIKAKFSYGLGAETSNQIIDFFLSSKRNKSVINKDELLSLSTFESDRYAKSVINEILQVNARLIVSAFIIIYFIYTYGVSFIFFVMFIVFIYILISFIIRHRLHNSGKVLTNSNQNRLRNINDIYDTFLEIKSFHAEEYFKKRQKQYNNNIANSLANIELYSVLPRYLVEGIIFLFLIMFMSYQYSVGGNSATHIIPLGAELIYGVMKLIPQISNVYQAYSNLTGNLSAVDVITKVNERKYEEEGTLVQKDSYVKTVKKIVIKNLCFSHDDNKIFTDFNYEFKTNKIYAIKGPSGVGKSTLLSLLFNSLEHDSGNINFLDNNNKNIINPKIAIIPQDNHLVFGNIGTNVAFGLEEYDISNKTLNYVLEKVNLGNLINNEKSDLKLSGGQIQRISIGRFLYHNYDIVILDEPTSALDPRNEKVIFRLLKEIKKDKIIIMISHSDVADDYTDEIIRLG